jgi:hypothetical protein
MKLTKTNLKKNHNKNSKQKQTEKKIKQNTMDYYCHSQCNVCGWIIVASHPLNFVTL